MLVRCRVLPELTLVIVTITSESELVVIRVFDAVDVLLVGEDDDSSDEVSSELVAVRVEVVVVTVTDGDEVGGTVIVEDVVTGGGSELVSLELVELVDSSLLVAEDVGLVFESVAESVESDPPVDKETL